MSGSIRTKRKPRSATPRQRRRPKIVTTTTRSNIKTIRRIANPRDRLVVLYASKPGHARLKYLGRGKFGQTGRAKLFTAPAAQTTAQMLRDLYPQVLRGWTLSAGAQAGAAVVGSHAQRAPRRRLTQGADPAESLYRDKVRRDSEAAHRWLAKQAK